MDKRKELLQAAIARCQELQSENPTGQLVFDDELHRICSALLELKKDDEVTEHSVGYIGITYPGEPEICAPYVPQIDLSEINWADYSMPTLVSESLPEVHPFEQAEVSWDNAFVPSLEDEDALGFKRGELKTLFLAGRQSGKSMLTADLIEAAVEQEKSEWELGAENSRWELTWLYPDLRIKDVPADE